MAQAGLLYTSSDLDNAIRCFAKGLTLAARNESGWYNYGRVLLAKGRSGEAISCFRCAVTLAPGDVGAPLSLVEGLLHDRQVPAATAEVEKILNLAPLSRELLLGSVRLWSRRACQHNRSR
ncbi:MAG: tetratricopeptide repeat protein [Bryobacteraceae bacterium]|jgi:tetratricopeptide (TPR) repeat protein